MSKSESNSTLPALVPNSSSAITVTTGSQRIARRMAKNLLDLAHSQERALVVQRRYRIGEYEFREADHEQIQTWARILGMEPEEIVGKLESSQKRHPLTDEVYADFRLEDGAIVSLVWDFDLLPLTDWAWGRGLQIKRLHIVNSNSGSLPPLPDCLCELFCSAKQLTKLDLTPVPGLRELSCWDNQLTKLDLTPVPGLQVLECGSNPLTELDLTPVPSLQELNCWGNQLTELDLTPVPGLQTLDCEANELTALDLTPMANLQKLDCRHNQLTKLDLTPVPGLQILNCVFNQLTELDLTPVPSLRSLNCGGNQLTELDLNHVPSLRRLSCDVSVNIKGTPRNLEVVRR